MPVVQANNQPYSGTPSVEPSVETPSRYQTETATPAAFGGAVAGAVSGLGRDIGAAANTLAQTQDFVNKVNADDLTSKYIEAINKIEFGDPDKGDTGFVGKKGQDAISAFPAVRDQLSSIRTQLATGLNPGARILFDSETRRMQNYAMTRLGAHFNQEFNSHALAVSKAGVDNGLTAAANAISKDDDAGFEAGVGVAMRFAMDGLRRNGQDKDETIVNDTLQKIRSEAVKFKAEHLALTDPSAAQTFLKNNSDAMNRDEFNILMGRYRAGGAKIQALKDAGIMPEGQQRADDRATLYGDRSDSYGSPHSTGWGPLAPVAMQEMQKRGASTAFIQAAMGAGLAEGGFAQNWQKSWGSEESFGHWQFHRGGELDPYEEAHGNDHSTGTQVAYLMQKMEERIPGITKTNDPEKALDAINTQFERYAGNALGQRHGYLHQAQAHMGDMASNEGPSQPVAGGKNFTAFGDSIAAHLIRKAHVGGDESGAVGVYKPGNTSVAGWQPHDILRVINEAPASSINGKDVILSTGAANVKGELSKQNVDEITQEVDKLFDRGAKSVRILGVGNANFYSNHNDALSSIAGSYGAAGKPVAFTGPLTDVGSDGVHSKNPQGVFTAAAQTALPVQAQQPVSPVKVASTEGPPDQVTTPPLKLSRPLPQPEASDSFLPDTSVPGLADRLRQIDKTVPQGDLQRWFNAVHAARKYFNDQYQDGQRTLRLHEEETKAKSEAAKDPLITRILTGDNPPTRAEIGSNKFLTPEAKMQVSEFLARQNLKDPAAEVSKKNAMALVGAMSLSDGAPGKIYSENDITKEYTGGNLTKDDFKFVQTEFRNLHGPQGELEKTKAQWMTGIQHKILGDPVSAKFDPNAGVRLFNYRQYVNSKIKEYQTAKKNPVDLFRPDNPDYLGSDAALEQFQPSREDKAKTLDNAVSASQNGTDLTKMTEDQLKAWARSQGTAYAYDKAIAEAMRRGLIAPQAAPQPQAPVR